MNGRPFRTRKVAFSSCGKKAAVGGVHARTSCMGFLMELMTMCTCAYVVSVIFFGSLTRTPSSDNVRVAESGAVLLERTSVLCFSVVKSGVHFVSHFDRH